MALTLETLRRVVAGPARPATGSRGLSMWLYATDDAHAAIAAANYFDSAADRLVQGDVIFAATALGGTPALRAYIVTSATGAAAITVAQLANA